MQFAAHKIPEFEMDENISDYEVVSSGGGVFVFGKCSPTTYKIMELNPLNMEFTEMGPIVTISEGCRPNLHVQYEQILILHLSNFGTFPFALEKLNIQTKEITSFRFEHENPRLLIEPPYVSCIFEGKMLVFISSGLIVTLDLKKIKVLSIEATEIPPYCDFMTAEVCGTDVYLSCLYPDLMGVCMFNTIDKKWTRFTNNSGDEKMDYKWNLAFIWNNEFVYLSKVYNRQQKMEIANYMDAMNIQTKKWRRVSLPTKITFRREYFHKSCLTRNKVFYLKDWGEKPEIHILHLNFHLQIACELTIVKHTIDWSRQPTLFRNRLNSYINV